MLKNALLLVSASLCLLTLPAPALAIGDVCSNVLITFQNSTPDEVKVTKFEYYDYSANTWRTEVMFGVDGHQKLDPGKSWSKTQDLEKIENDKTKFKVTYQRHIGGSKWDDAVSTLTSDFTCKDGLKKTVTISSVEESPAASNVFDCGTTQTAEIREAIAWGSANWPAYEKALEAIRGWPVNVGQCLKTRFQSNGKVVCKAGMDGNCKGANGWASPFTKKCHMCPDFLTTVAALPSKENRQACYFALVTHEWGHTCERGHKTLEIIDDEAFKHWKSKHSGVTITLRDCGMN